MTKKLFLYDGMKEVELWSGDKGWDVISGPSSVPGRAMSLQDYFISVPWLYRAVKDRATTLKKVSFAIVNDSGAELDASGTWKNELGIFPYPRRMLHQIEESLVMTGRAYLFLETNDYGYVKSVKYCLPTSIKEVYDDNGDLLHYERAMKRERKVVAKENIVAIYDPDYTVEQGPGNSSAAKAAMLAAGVLFNTDMFIAQYFLRGAIKATILSVDTADQKEAARLQAWWEDVVAGIKNAWTALVIRAKSAIPTIIGHGLEGLENDSLTKSKRQDISTAIGVPESRLWASSANYATAEVEARSYFNDVIVPECWNIEEALNAQLFTVEHHMEGYRWEFRPETGAGYSKDQQAQSTAYVGYVGSGMLPSVAAQLVGLELPGEMEYEDLDPEEEDAPLPKVEPVQQPLLPPPPTEAVPLDDDMSGDMLKWQRKAVKWLERGKALADMPFESDCIPNQVEDQIREGLSACTNTEKIKAVFDQVKEEEPTPIDSMYLLALELRRANDLVEATA
jgi:hypothetical protein